MYKSELNTDTISQLKDGTVYTSEAGLHVIIGETDTVAFEDAHGWQVAEGIVWNNVQGMESEEVLGYMLKEADFTQVGDNFLYIGPLTPAVMFIRKNNEVNKDGARDLATGLWTVELDGGNVWGHGDTPEMAWRYAIGAEFRSLDSEFHPFPLK